MSTFPDDTYEIFRKEVINITQPSHVCDSAGEVGRLYHAQRVEIILAKDPFDMIPDQSYTVRIYATVRRVTHLVNFRSTTVFQSFLHFQDPGGNSGETHLTLNFKPRDIFPPIFEHLHYSARIDKPEVSKTILGMSRKFINWILF